jgi:hypothetical protein
MKKTVYTLRPGISILAYKGRRVMPGEWIDDNTLVNNPSFMPMVADFPEPQIREQMPVPVAPLLTEQMPVSKPTVVQEAPVEKLEKPHKGKRG